MFLSLRGEIYPIFVNKKDGKWGPKRGRKTGFYMTLGEKGRGAKRG